jgi:hypothetical protein
MNTKTKWLGAAVLALMGLAAGRAEAGQGTSSYLYIDVTITNTLSVSVNSVGASSQAVTWTGASALAATSIATVTNDTGYLAERWELKTTAFSADSTNGATGWTIAGSPGVETVEVQAVFVSAAATSCPLTTGSEWANVSIAPALSVAQTAYTSALLADTGFSGANAQPDNLATSRLNAGSSRGLCWKLSMPTSTGLSDAQIVPVIVTAF